MVSAPRNFKENWSPVKAVLIDIIGNHCNGFAFLKSYLFILKVLEGEVQRNVSSAASVPRWPQLSALEQEKDMRLTHLLCGWQGPTCLEHPLLLLGN